MEWVLAFATAVVHPAREAVLAVLSHAVAWSHLSPTPATLRRRLLTTLPEQEDTIAWIQNKVRTPFFDSLMVWLSLTADQDFLMVLIPAGFWLIDPNLPRFATYAVCIGHWSGNVIKDVFTVRRPSPSRVWWSPSLLTADTNALMDHGFPSTHSMVGVGVPGILLVYSGWMGWLFGPGQLLASVLAVCGVVGYALTLTFSRLYLGVHSLRDVRAGFVLGLIELAFFATYLQTIDKFLLTDTTLAPWILLLLGPTLLAINPQPIPKTPTFLHNCEIVGLMLSNMLGARLLYFHNLYDVQATSVTPLPVWSKLSTPLSTFVASLNLSPTLLHTLRITAVVVLGVLLAAIVRAIVKSVCAALLGSGKGVDREELISKAAATPTPTPTPTSSTPISTTSTPISSSSTTSTTSPSSLRIRKPGKDAKAEEERQGGTPDLLGTDMRRGEIVEGIVDPKDPPHVVASIAAQAATKCLTYTAIGVTITYACPVLFDALGLQSMGQVRVF